MTSWMLNFMVNLPLKFPVGIFLSVLFAMNGHTDRTHWQETVGIRTKIGYQFIPMKGAVDDHI
jgi:hypothetical protein